MPRLTRAVFLPHFGDPLAFAYWFSWYQRVLSKEVDKLYVFSSNISKESAQFIERLLKDADPSIWYEWQEEPKQHGDTLAYLTKICPQELIMFIEDDAMVFKPGAVDAAFELIESGQFDAVGSARGSCSPEIIEAAYRKWNIPAHGDVRDNGCNFWPNFFFAKRSDLIKTDMNFNAVGWAKGDRIDMLGIVAPHDLASDTFGWASLQLRNLGLRFGYVPQYHGHPDDPSDYEARRNLWDGGAKWVHHGSLSSWRMLFEEVHHAIIGLDIGEITRRLQWWMTYYDFFCDTYPDQLHEFRAAYLRGIVRIGMCYSVSPKEIKRRQKMYQELMG